MSELPKNGRTLNFKMATQDLVAWNVFLLKCCIVALFLLKFEATKQLKTKTRATSATSAGLINKPTKFQVTDVNVYSIMSHYAPQRLNKVNLCNNFHHRLMI